MTPYRVPAGTTEITYTRGAGEQRSIPIQHLGEGYDFAQGEDLEDEAHLAGLFPVARKVLGQNEEDPAPVKASRSKSKKPKAIEPPASEAAEPAPPVETSAGTEG